MPVDDHTGHKADTAAAVAEGWSLLLPDNWYHIRLDENRHQQATALVRRAFAALPRDAVYLWRRGLEQQITALLEDALTKGGSDIYLLVDPRYGLPLAATCLASLVPVPLPSEVPAEILGRTLATRDGDRPGVLQINGQECVAIRRRESAPVTDHNATPAAVPGAAVLTVTGLDVFLPFPGIERSLERRFAHLADVSVNDVLWVNRNTRPQMKDGSIADILMAAAITRPSRDLNAETVSITAFMKDILPGATEIDLLVKNAHANNFVSITTGANAGAPPVLKWDNDFAWSYGGNVTDSIKEKVKRAGGNVTGKLRVSLSWFNYDDLDIHVIEPNGNHIWYSSKQGKLDVDMNAGGPKSRDAVENVCWTTGIQDGGSVFRGVVPGSHRGPSER